MSSLKQFSVQVSNLKIQTSQESVKSLFECYESQKELELKQLAFNLCAKAKELNIPLKRTEAYDLIAKLSGLKSRNAIKTQPKAKIVSELCNGVLFFKTNQDMLLYRESNLESKFLEIHTGNARVYLTIIDDYFIVNDNTIISTIKALLTKKPSFYTLDQNEMDTKGILAADLIDSIKNNTRIQEIVDRYSRKMGMNKFQVSSFKKDNRNEKLNSYFYRIDYLKNNEPSYYCFEHKFSNEVAQGDIRAIIAQLFCFPMSSDSEVIAVQSIKQISRDEQMDFRMRGFWA